MIQTVLALETSCDESAVAVVQFELGKISVLSSCIASQVNEHSTWGGVVPEIASRRHLEALPFLIDDALKDADQEISSISCIAATVAPGLSGSLLIGSITGRTLSALHSLPFIGIHHLEGHLASAQLTEDFHLINPYLVLLVSGGHTELIKVDQNRNFSRLGNSHDDAAGEAFDKVARLLSLPYPGGPAIEKLAERGDPFRFSLPKGRVSNPEGGFYPYAFSFSGLKTAMLRKIEGFDKETLPREDLAASFQRVVAEVLVDRSIKCALDNGLKHLVVVGGVAANLYLRKLILDKASQNSIEVFLAPKRFCTDNAAMIGAAALARLLSGSRSSSLELGVSARMPLDQAHLLYEAPPPF